MAVLADPEDPTTVAKPLRHDLRVRSLCGVWVRKVLECGLPLVRVTPGTTAQTEKDVDIGQGKHGQYENPDKEGHRHDAPEGPASP
jgi:hypothetical protein